jgi:hypothetical protein
MRGASNPSFFPFLFLLFAFSVLFSLFSFLFFLFPVSRSIFTLLFFRRHPEAPGRATPTAVWPGALVARVAGAAITEAMAHAVTAPGPGRTFPLGFLQAKFCSSSSS